MKERVKKIRTAAHLTQEEFAKKLGLSRNHIAQVETDKGSFSDRTICDICRIFNVNETWLRTGEGEMFKPLTRNQEIANFLNDVMEDDETGFKSRFVTALAKLDTDDWETLAKIIDSLANSEE